MLHKLIFKSMITFFILEIITTLGAQSESNITKNSLIYRFCISRMKSKAELKRKQNFKEISSFTCECFYNKYKSGYSLKGSRIYCKNKASEKYNL